MDYCKSNTTTTPPPPSSRTSMTVRGGGGGGGGGVGGGGGGATMEAQDSWRKGPWTAQEDSLLIHHVNLHGEGNWNSVAKETKLRRCGKSCRLRWVNYLRPDLKRGKITSQEENVIVHMHTLWGNRWAAIARCLPGRTDNEIKNYWRTHHFKPEDRKPSISKKVEKARAEFLHLKRKRSEDEVNYGSIHHHQFEVPRDDQYLSSCVQSNHSIMTAAGRDKNQMEEEGIPQLQQQMGMENTGGTWDCKEGVVVCGDYSAPADTGAWSTDDLYWQYWHDLDGLY